MKASEYANGAGTEFAPGVVLMTLDESGNAVGGGAIGTAPAALTLVALAVSSVVTGGTAVVALAAGQKTKGGWIKNPVTATVDLGINEIGTASGTTSAGSTTFISPGETYVLAPSAGAVSVIAADSAHAFSGMGWN